MNKFWKYFAYFALVWGAFFTIGGLLVVFSEGNVITNLLTFIVIGFAPLITGYLILRNIKVKTIKEKEEQIECNILKLAQSKRGVLSVSELSVDLNLPVEESRFLLDRFVVKGLADTDISDSGAIYYRFRELADD